MEQDPLVAVAVRQPAPDGLDEGRRGQRLGEQNIQQSTGTVDFSSECSYFVMVMKTLQCESSGTDTLREYLVYKRELLIYRTHAVPNYEQNIHQSTGNSSEC